MVGSIRPIRHNQLRLSKTQAAAPPMLRLPLPPPPTPVSDSFQRSPVRPQPSPQAGLPPSSVVTLTQQQQALLNQFPLPQLDQQTYKQLQAETFKDKGNKLFVLGYYDQAIAEYLKALYTDPSYTDAYYNLGRIYMVQDDPRRAGEAFRRLLQLTPDDLEVRNLLAKQYAEQGKYPDALQQYQIALAYEPTFDPALRNEAYLRQQMLAITQPQLAQEQFIQHAASALEEAKVLVKEFFTAKNRDDILDLMKAGLPYQFVPTEQRKLNSNMAEFDFTVGGKGLIRISPELAYAQPNVLAAYLVHELIHAADQDPLSSIMEEQNAYRAQAEFWGQYRGQVKDTNLDLAVDLKQQSVDLLDQEVRRSYGDDDLLPEKSPGHGLPKNSDALIEYNQAKLAKFKTFQIERLKSLLPF